MTGCFGIGKHRDLHLKDAKAHAIYCFLQLWGFFVYKFQFRGLQPFRVKHDDHSLLIFVVVNVFVQKTSFCMYHKEKHAAFQEGIETQIRSLEDQETSDFFFFTLSLPCCLPKKVLGVGAWLETTKSNLIIYRGFFPYMHAVGLPLFTRLASMPSEYHLAEALV